MASSKTTPMAKPKNKLRRSQAYLSMKKAKESSKRDDRFRRKREEAKDPSLREERLAHNVPATIDSKRVWDGGAGDEEDALGWAIDVTRLAKKRRLDEDEQQEDEDGEEGTLAKLKRMDDEADEEQDEEVDSMLDSHSEPEDEEPSDSETRSRLKRRAESTERASSPATSTGTNLNLSPEFLRERFPAVFNAPDEPKVLITTSLHSTLHEHCAILESLIPNSTYIRRSRHAHSHSYSVREISQFASNRNYTHLVVLMQSMQKKVPDGLDIITLPDGPHFHFSVTSWIEGKKLPGHGNPTNHNPELILNGFRTPLGMLTATLFKGLYGTQPEHEGRNVVTLHNQRDYIFVRRHRYVFRTKRASEHSIVGTDGRVVKGAEELKAGLQELGPRFTLKLRRIDRGIQFKSGQEWEWKGKMEKQKTRFAM
ncbi:Brix-domain-containing protein [Polyplosphaeria fusca]|uniref:Brix-domain-containing protein n=1 Tax=Polyplosphaeria fusca TaxID=682080 RepID=A0A9P4R0C8_9PLEO|nr:Brix-domain-containing protein [Polyplosphaeria fusca]